MPSQLGSGSQLSDKNPQWHLNQLPEHAREKTLWVGCWFIWAFLSLEAGPAGEEGRAGRSLSSGGVFFVCFFAELGWAKGRQMRIGRVVL